MNRKLIILKLELINNQTEKSDNINQKENQALQNFAKEKEIEKVKIFENNQNKNQSNNNINRFNKWINFWSCKYKFLIT